MFPLSFSHSHRLLLLSFTDVTFSSNPLACAYTQNSCKYIDYQTGNYNNDKAESVLAKTAPGFLDNLNAKLAEQRATNKAYAVRSYINSKVVVSKFAQI